MLYAAAREMVSYIIARSPHGMQRLTSIAFYEAAPSKCREESIEKQVE
jgi:hypothetical protein